MSLIDTINAANGVGQDAITSNADYQSSLADAKEAVAEFAKANGVSLEAINEMTDAGSANQAMFAGLAESAQASAKAQLEYDSTVMSAEEATARYFATVDSGRKALYEQILALTGNADAAQALTDKVYAIPSQAEVNVVVSTAAANAAIDATTSKLQRLKDLYTLAPKKGTGLGVLTSTGNSEGFAKGGFTGAGDPNKIAGPVHLAEFVSTAATTAIPANRAALEYMHAGGSMANYGAYATPQYAPAGPSYSTSVGGSKTIHIENKTYGTAGMTPELTSTLIAQKTNDALRGV